MSHSGQRCGLAPDLQARGARTGAPPPRNLPPPNYNTDNISVVRVADAQMHAKFAVSALGFEDVHTAVDNLKKALALLTAEVGVEALGDESAVKGLRKLSEALPQQGQPVDLAYPLPPAHVRRDDRG